MLPSVCGQRCRGQRGAEAGVARADRESNSSEPMVMDPLHVMKKHLGVCQALDVGSLSPLCYLVRAKVSLSMTPYCS